MTESARASGTPAPGARGPGRRASGARATGERARRRRGRLAATVAALLVVGTVAATIVSDGFAARSVDDASGLVWVVNQSRQAVGRIETAVPALDQGTTTATGNIEVLQDGATVLIADLGSREISRLDPGTGELGAAVALPPGRLALALAAGVLVVHSESSGELRVQPVAELDAFDAEAPADLNLGAESVSSVDGVGRLVAYSAATGVVSTVDVTDSVLSAGTRAAELGDDITAVTSSGGVWAALDPIDRRLELAIGPVELADLVPAGSSPVLQRASVDGDAVLVAFDGGLVEVALGSGAARAVESAAGSTGAPARPIVAGGCSRAAWGDGALWRRCTEPQRPFPAPAQGPAEAPVPAGTSADAAAGTAAETPGPYTPPVAPGDSDGERTVVPAIAGHSDLEIRHDGVVAVVNASGSGGAWSFDEPDVDPGSWDAVLEPAGEPDVDSGEIELTDPVETDTVQVAPVAQPDDLGARPGRASLLPVLLNDSDANGDPLVITDVTALDPDDGRIDVVGDGQQLRVEPAPGATGSLSLQYTIDDGRGGTSSTTLEIGLRADDENSAPVQARATSIDVAAGGQGSRQVLADWFDPDGDPLVLVGATAPAAAEVGATAEPDGTVIVTAAASPDAAPSVVGIEVSDTVASATGNVDVAAHPASAVPIHADAFTVDAAPGADVTITPLAHVRGGAGPVRLTAVPSVDGAVTVVDPASGEVRFSTTLVGDHLLSYEVGDGASTAVGRIRVRVADSARPGAAPLTVPVTAFLRGGAPTDVDVLAGAVDPSGGVLLVTAAAPVGSAALGVEIVEGRMLRLTPLAPLGPGGATVAYTLSNGAGESSGVVTVVELDALTEGPPPLAVADAVVVRAGAFVDIPVLENDTVPAGRTASIDDDLVVADDAGLLFVADDRLRFLAPSEPGLVTAEYRLRTDDGQWSTAPVTISVREPDAAGNSAPTPKTVTARTVAGGTVRIPIPVDGIDPDGDAVRLLAQKSAPDRGTVVDIDGDEIVYRAADYATGTDTFSYTVVDDLGARSSAEVRVGIAQEPAVRPAPSAVGDETTGRPGATLVADVLANDSDPAGGPLTIVSVESGDPRATADTDGETVTVALPDGEGRFGFVYTIAADDGATSSTFLSVEATASARPARPVVRDRVLDLADIAGRDVVDVDVLDAVVFAEGGRDALRVETVPGFDDGVVSTRSGALEVEIGDVGRVVPFAVSRVDDPSIVSHAFVVVAGRTDSLPMIRRDAPPLVVRSGEQLPIDVSAQLVAADGRRARIADPNSVVATRAAPGTEVRDGDTILFRSEPGYFGPAAVSFEVTDDEASPPSRSRVTTVVLPVTVLPAERQPPRFSGTTLELEPGQERSIDLARLTSTAGGTASGTAGGAAGEAGGTAGDGLAFALPDGAPEGFSASVDGRRMLVSATAAATPGSLGSIPVEVTDSAGLTTTGRIDLTVVASTRPRVVPGERTVVVARGTTAEFDVLADAEATNPFPGAPLQLAGVDDTAAGRGLVLAETDRATIAVSVASDAAPGVTDIRYRVLDATGLAERGAWGMLRVSVQDVPAAVGSLALVSATDRSLTLGWRPGADNGSPITAYLVEARSVSTGAVVAAVPCQGTSCSVPTAENGPAGAVTVRVVARNAIGDSPPVALDGVVWSDVVPEPPRELDVAPLDGGLVVRWRAPASTGSGSPVTGYVVTAGSRTLTVAAGPERFSETVVDPAAFPNGTAVSVSVAATNGTMPAFASWRSATAAVTPFGAPTAGDVRADADASSGAVTVGWSPFDGRGDPILGYVVQRLAEPAVPTGVSACSVSAPVPGTPILPKPGGAVLDQVVVAPGAPPSWTFDGLTETDARYAFVVWGYNRAGCASTATVQAVPRPSPGAVDGVDGRMSAVGASVDFVIDGVRGADAPAHRLRAVDAAGEWTGSEVDLVAGRTPRDLLDAPFGEVLRFRIRACNVWGEAAACGPWSAVVSSPEPPVSLAPAGLDYRGSRWLWTAPPPNGELTARFACGSVRDEDLTGVVSANSCAFRRDPGGVWLDVTVAGRTHRFTR